MNAPVTLIVGKHVYSRLGPFEARDRVQARCPSGWRAYVHLQPAKPLPVGALSVGRVQSRPGAPEYPLYIVREAS